MEDEFYDNVPDMSDEELMTIDHSKLTKKIISILDEDIESRRSLRGPRPGAESVMVWIDSKTPEEAKHIQDRMWGTDLRETPDGTLTRISQIDDDF